MRVEQIYRYPVKGFSPEALEDVTLEAGECLPFDRVFALAQADAPLDPDHPVWLRKTNFACLAANARLALLHTAYDAGTDTWLIRPPQGEPLRARLSTPEGRAAVEDFLTAFLGEEARGRLRLLRGRGHHFTDIPQKSVSIISLKSLAALEAASGQRLDPLRFRANFYVSGGAEWGDFALLDQEVMLGRARLRVWKRIVRCAATEVNPQTAERDANPPRELRKAFGHIDLGVQAEVLEGGLVAVGDALEAIQPA
ncbi:MOSC domain-containing protein [Roseococcus sp. DSY-14]|uniref:MOSC domain-containing protein n=1 Tax=Roseococcus sp. DSY-14 TaxID=3369650 RepID=UPI00387B9178